MPVLRALGRRKPPPGNSWVTWYMPPSKKYMMEPKVTAAITVRKKKMTRAGTEARSVRPMMAPPRRKRRPSLKMSRKRRKRNMRRMSMES